MDRAEFDRKYGYGYATLMMQQYLDVKYEHLDAVLMFRMGDFYEMFFDDAVAISKVLGLALGKRGKVGDEDVPMCGMPYHAVDHYIQKLVDENYKIAICEQMETPEEAKKRGGYKAVVQRNVTRIITAGTLIEDSVLSSITPNYLCAVTVSGTDFSMCYADISTGVCKVFSDQLEKLSNHLDRIAPKEILIAQKSQDDAVLQGYLKSYFYQLVYLPNVYMQKAKAIRAIEEVYNTYSHVSLGEFSDDKLCALGAVLGYIMHTHKSSMPMIQAPVIENVHSFMYLDSCTLRSLEIVRTPNGYKGSFFDVINNTVTKMGSRMLYDMLLHPSSSAIEVERRLKITDFFYEDSYATSTVRKLLNNISDIERIVTRVSTRKVSPRDILALRDSLKIASDIKSMLLSIVGVSSVAIDDILSKIVLHNELADMISKALLDDVPNTIVDGGVMRPTCHSKLAELHNLLTNSTEYLNNLREKYQRMTGVDNLKIAHNGVMGIFIEVTVKQSSRIDITQFIHKQTTTNAVRYTTPELQELESKIMTAKASMVSMEQELFLKLCEKISGQAGTLRELALGLAELDVFTAFAYNAKEYNYVRPILCDSVENKLHIIGGRHPVVERILHSQNKVCVSNDCMLSDHERVWLITGPNMGGKSTFLRQNALIVLMAQIGSYVSADECHISMVDKILSRVGSSDDLSKGQSTFMVEMLETSAILMQGTANSLLILDEVGRGTSTYDGVAIAWSILEYIHNNIKAKCLFATHYHELSALQKDLTALRNYHVVVDESCNQILMTYKIAEGYTDKSYGLHVAAIAGIPSSVIERAENILSTICVQS